MIASPPTPLPRKGVTIDRYAHILLAAPPWGGPAEAP